MSMTRNFRKPVSASAQSNTKNFLPAAIRNSRGNRPKTNGTRLRSITRQGRRAIPKAWWSITAAAPPPESVLAAMVDAGFNVTHVYGLTETYGPAVVNEWRAAWEALESNARAARKARQGVRYHALDGLAVMDPETMEPVPADGQALGEVMFRGNIVMKGY